LKENKFKNLNLKLDTDSSMDERILEHFTTFSKSTNAFKFKKRVKSFFIHIPRVAVLFTILIVCSSLVGWAAIKYVKTYPIDIQIQIPEENDNVISNSERTRQHFKKVEDAFAILELPNLFPTYVMNNYYLNNDRCTYMETKYDDGSVSKEIYASFYSNDAQAKRVDITFLPTLTSQKDSGVTMLTDANVTTSAYVTKSGLHCSIAEIDGEEDFEDGIIAFLNFDSETLGYGCYSIYFDDIEIKEIKKILDSIPIVEKETN
jgi:hypothetical protein